MRTQHRRYNRNNAAFTARHRARRADVRSLASGIFTPRHIADRIMISRLAEGSDGVMRINTIDSNTNSSCYHHLHTAITFTMLGLDLNRFDSAESAIERHDSMTLMVMLTDDDDVDASLLCTLLIQQLSTSHRRDSHYSHAHSRLQRHQQCVHIESPAAVAATLIMATATLRTLTLRATTRRRYAHIVAATGGGVTRNALHRSPLALTHRLATARLSQSITSSPWSAMQYALNFSTRSGPLLSSRPSSFAAPVYTTREVGERGTKEWRLYVQLNGKDVSLWHDIPLLAQGSSGKQILFNYVNEIPKHTRPKYEIATKELGTPIKQDMKKDVLRSFTYGDLPFNYGCLPQTWENPHEAHVLTKLYGDNDPIDVVELSTEPISVGDVRAVKIVGVIALFDENETDWKLLAIDASHPHASQIQHIDDIERFYPGRIHEIREWFRHYKTSDGAPQNKFGFEEKVLDVAFAMKIVWETHAAWAALVRGELPRSDLWLLDEIPKSALKDQGPQ